MPTKNDSPPDFLDIAHIWIYERFGVTGLAVLAVATLVIYLWRHSEAIKRWPGVMLITKYITRKPVPTANPAQFSIMVARLADDEKDKFAKLIAHLLAEFGGIQTFNLDRIIDANGAESSGHETARRYLEQSGAFILIWGRMLHLNGQSRPQLYITTSHGATRRPKQYVVETVNEFRLPTLFWQDLAHVLRLLIVKSAIEFSDEKGRYVADRLPPYINRLRALLDASKDRPEWTADARASIHVLLGSALQTLGSQTGTSQPLEQAVSAFKNGLQEWTRDKAPLSWALTQNNLGAALGVLGKRESGAARLKEAVDAFSFALLVLTQEQSPLDWARVQNNLGAALAALGERESDPARLKEAIAAHKNALLERTREKAPLDWATTQNNLGGALAALGHREMDATRLKEAVLALNNALLVWTREMTPLDWAGTLNNLGNALVMIWELERDPACLQQAVVVYNQALLEWLPEKVPLEWAMTQRNLGGALTKLALLENDQARIKQAIAACEEALKVYTRETTPLDWAATQNNLGSAFLALGRWESGTAPPKKAVAAFNNALDVYRTSGTTYYIEPTITNLDKAQALIVMRQER